MASRTQQQLAEEVLLEIGRADLIDPAQSSQDIEFVKSRYQALYQALEEKAFWDIDAIPERVFVPMAKHVAFSVREAYGNPNYTGVDDENRTPLQQVKAVAMVETSGFPTVGQYY